jgi:ribonuclease HII
MIIGIDEVGRGCLAGPLLAAAVEFDNGIDIIGVKDSKKLSRCQREGLVPMIESQSSQYGIGWVWPEEINKIGLTESVRLAMQRAIDKLDINDQTIIIDGNYNYLNHIDGSSCLIKADDLVQQVAAASVLAKVARDKYMYDISTKYPGYLFEKNVGYGTKHHMSAIENLGITPIHRTSFSPIKELLLYND